MPRSNLFTTLLVAAMLCLAVMASLLSVRYYFSLRELQRMQARYYQVERTMTAVRSLAASCLQYAETHPEMRTLLEEFELGPTTTNPPPVTMEGVVPTTP